MKKIEHLGIAVNNLEQSNTLFEKLLNRTPYKTETVESEGVKTSFFRIGESKIELLEPLSKDSTLARFLKKRGPGLHHLAFEVEDIKSEMKRLKENGFELINDAPKKGADNKWVCFLYPKTTNGVLIELCQERDDII